MKILNIALMCLSLLAIGTAVAVYAITPHHQRLVIATTTSTIDSGLMDYLKPHFESLFNADMTWLYLGTGQAMEAAARGDADILLVHDRTREDAFVSSGNGTLRVTVMYNDFVIIGPPSDPANIRGENATSAMERIHLAGLAGRTVFVSRGDGSGTNALEERLWAAAGVNVSGPWYLSTGSGMAPVIRLANEKGGYALTDRATFLKLQSTMNSTLALVILCENDTSLLNPYSIILLNSTKYPFTKSDLAVDFLLFMVSQRGQSLIGNFTLNNQQLFFPVYGEADAIGLPPEDDTVAFINSLLEQRGMG